MISHSEKISSAKLGRIWLAGERAFSILQGLKPLRILHTMEITQLIKELERILEDHGDLDVVVDGTSAKRVGIRLHGNGKLFVEITSDKN